MNWKWHIENLVRRIFGMESLEEERMKRLMGIRMDLEIREAGDPMYALLSDFSLESVTICKRDGRVIVGNGSSEIDSVLGSRIFEKLKEELPEAEYVMLKIGDRVRVIYTDGEYIYIAGASGYVSPLEMKLIARKFKRDVDAQAGS